MRLIDADVLLDTVKNKYSDIVAGGYPYNVVAHDLVKLIESQPTAYDPDKIISYIDRVENSGMGKKKSLEYIKKFIKGGETDE